jgi:hypothetical protein
MVALSSPCLLISCILIAFASWLGYHISSVIIDNCDHCDTGGGGDPQQAFSGYGERAEDWKEGKLEAWDVAVSGPASSADAPEVRVYTSWFGKWLKERPHIKTIVDVSSGHWPSGWQRGVEWSGQEYLGVDITPKMIEDNTAYVKEKGFKHFGLKNITFAHGDMMKDLPAADLLITKDTIIHIPNWAILEFLKNNVNSCPPKYKEVLFVHDKPPEWKFRWGGVPVVRHIVRNWDCPKFSDFHEIDIRVHPYHVNAENIFQFDSSTRADRKMENPKVVQYFKPEC